jgi:prophage regulatory protein
VVECGHCGRDACTWTETVGNERNQRSPGLFYLRRAVTPERAAVSQKLIPYEDLRSKGISLSKVQIWRLERAGKFPARVTLSAQRVAWVESEIDGFVASRIAARTQTVAA